MTGDLQPDAAIEAAARFVVEREHTSPVISDLRTRFGLTTAQAIQAIREANRLRGYAVHEVAQ